MIDETEVREPEVRTAFNEARQAAELIPVGSGGVAVQNFAQQVDFAKWLAKADFAIPKHLRGNVGACLAIAEIAGNTGLSSYGVANATYVQNDKLCFESKLVHAIVERSGLLKGRLKVRYEGSGGDLTCYVYGTLKGDAEPSEWPLPGQAIPLKDLHPGYSLAKREGNETSKKHMTYAEGEALKAAGLPQGAELHCKGSPLWSRKPHVQLFYDHCRDWARVYTPEALLGIFTGDEMDEYEGQIGPDRAKDVTPNDPGASLHERLKAAGRGEDGFREGVVESGLNGHASNNTTQSSAPADVGAAVGTASVASLNSSQDNAPLSSPETKPAPSADAPLLAGAGTTQSLGAPSVERKASSGEERQATESGHDAPQSDSAGLPELPEDWPRQYAAALNRAQKIGSLSKYAAEFWKAHGGWDAHKSGPHAATAIAIYDAFANNFADAEARNTILHELGAA
ncbi:MAG TPA: hypothetical protein VLJ17_02445 [Xanthobacteraceae bacterium]|nr:hypothetical protein [Xanthobacteraceae bacterium]